MQIWVVVEGDDHGLRESSREILTAAATVAGGQIAAAVVLAPDNKDLVQEVMEFGPQTIYFSAGQTQPSALGEGLAEFIGKLIKDQKPSLVLAAESLFGRELFTRMALLYKMPFFPDCINILREQENLLFERLWYGGRISAFQTSGLDGPWLATWHKGLVNVKKWPGVLSNVLKLSPTTSKASLARFFQEIKAAPQTVDLCEAEVIVAGGAGMGSALGFKLIFELAELIGAAVGGSRVARDNGWIPLSRQIGQTGKTVAPKLIISCGISGATQHTFGMRDAKRIIAINKDKNAPIFKIADTGIVGDVQEVLLELIKRIREGKQNVRPVGA